MSQTNPRCPSITHAKKAGKLGGGKRTYTELSCPHCEFSAKQSSTVLEHIGETHDGALPAR